MKDLQIRDLDHLKELLKDREQLDTYVLLGCNCRSSKTFLNQEDGYIVIVHEIDGHTSTLHSIDKIVTSKKTELIAEALLKGRLYVFGYELEKGEANGKKSS